MARHPHGSGQWAKALLDELGLPRSKGAVYSLKQWARAEGGHWNNTAHYNPLNTTQEAPGATAMNSVGVKAYGSWDQGLKATVQTLKNGNYDGILKALHRGDYSAFSQALVSSPWGTKVLPGGGTPPPPGGGKVHSRQRGRNGTPARHVPGVDNSALRQQLLLGYLDERNSPDALLNLASGLEGAQDIPGMTVPGTRGRARARGNGREIVTAAGSVQKMLRKAEKWNKVAPPYLWGGGHGSIAKPGDPVDCSGFVSAVLGLKSPLVSGDLMSYGKPGKGKWITVYAHSGHTIMSIRDPRTKKVRWFGTSQSNPGGGAGEIPHPSASYLSAFAVRHPG